MKSDLIRSSNIVAILLTPEAIFLLTVPLHSNISLASVLNGLIYFFTAATQRTQRALFFDCEPTRSQCKNNSGPNPDPFYW
jgi:hypothetical protein